MLAWRPDPGALNRELPRRQRYSIEPPQHGRPNRTIAKKLRCYVLDIVSANAVDSGQVL